MHETNVKLAVGNIFVVSFMLCGLRRFEAKYDSGIHMTMDIQNWLTMGSDPENYIK